MDRKKIVICWVFFTIFAGFISFFTIFALTNDLIMPEKAPFYRYILLKIRYFL